ncbi:MAG: phage tail assembly protein [Oscillospiraceae bacterium]
MYDEKQKKTEEQPKQEVPAEETAEATQIAVTEQEEFSPTLVKFAKPYTFEGKTYTQIDLSGLESLTAKDMVDAENWLTKNGTVSALPEMSMQYANFIAARASGQPIEFFKRLSPKNAIKVKNRVTNFFYGED